MSQVFVAEKGRESPRGDMVLTATVLVLGGLGLAVLFSASYFRAEVLYGDPLRMFTGQAINALLGLVIAMVVARLPQDILLKLVPLMVAVAFLLMVATFIPGLGASFLGGHRWILIGGRSFQPSELVKLVVVVYLASILAKKGEGLREPLTGLLPPLVIVLGFVILIYLQNNFSTAVFVLAVATSMFFIAGVRMRFFVMLALVAIPLIIGGVLARDHRMERLNVYINPNYDTAGSGYQTAMSQAAIKSGELFGKGMGLGTRKLGRLPEAQSDFIFAVIAEELGYIGVVAVLGLFGVFTWRGYRLSWYTTHPFDKLLAFGITTSVVLQSLINISVTVGLVPPTGVPLPFFSAGGSSMLLTLIMAGFLFNIAGRTSFEKEVVRG